MMNKLKNKAMICVWLLLSLLPMLTMPLAIAMVKSGTVMSVWINKRLDHCILKLVKYEDAE